MVDFKKLVERNREEKQKTRLESFKPWNHDDRSWFRIVEANIDPIWHIVIEDEKGNRYSRYSIDSRVFTHDLQQFCSDNEIEVLIGAVFQIVRKNPMLGHHYYFYKAGSLDSNRFDK